MLIPVRCFSCGFVIGEYADSYKELVAKGKSPKESMDSLGIERYCCRRMFLASKEYIDDLNKYHK